MKMDEMDFKIIEELRKDARLSMRELAKRVNLSSPSVTERVRRLESKGIIEEYTIKTNPKKMGYGAECIIEVTLKQAEYDRFKLIVQRHPGVVFCYRISGKSCYMVKLNVVAMQDVEQFIDLITPFAYTATYFILSEVPIRPNSVSSE
ncbi:AsnC family transcriptional regulator [Fictibacillus phosphorivorans]|uniref:AsnC family transcriptional regulator n=1 Tax=Fictibacillus phosphorivorans TaxID=1221500 RepID=A0A163PY72_9BACL|nr:Lrp/AsnC family transcriptional regulator [Fictibacillus phosphorivorans]KZE64302.1 AsnC family transcriptional regulator [Fictibacillus phosphorivorans]